MAEIDGRAIPFSLGVNTLLFVLLGSVSLGGCFAHPKEEIIPMEFLVVTEENAADRLAEEPNEAVEPEPEPPQPEPIPEPPAPEPPPPPPPVPDPDPIPPPPPPPQPKPKPKPAPEKPKVERPEPPKPKWKPTPVKISKERVGPVTTGKNDPKKAPTQKALSQAEIQRLLAAGAKSGNRNQIPPNEASRCYGIIAKAFRTACNKYGLETSPTGRDPVLTVTFGSGGSIRTVAIKTTSGDRRYDGQVLNACKQVRRVDGLSSSFLAEYKTIDLRLDVN